MVSEPRKIVFTSLLVGTVAIGAYFSQADHGWLSPDELGMDRNNGAAHSPRSDTMTGSVSAGPVAGRSDSTAAIAGDPRAARNSLQQDKPAAAQAQREAARAVDRSGEQALVPQRDVPARMAQRQAGPASTQAEGAAQQGSKSARASLSASGKTGRASGRHVTTPREASNRADTYAKNPRGSESAVAGGNAANTSGARTRGAGESVFAGPLISNPTQVKVVSNESSAFVAVAPAQPASALPSTSQSELTAQAVPSSSQAEASGGTLLQSESGPKTRAQVRAEIAHARATGSLPAFGNPDPAGPGGAPSLTLAPRP